MSEILFPDIGQCSLIKHSESICGDFCYVLRDGDRMTAVLSDGLGSGVKANILATLTSKILSTLIARDLPLDECIYTVASTLPMCSERKIAYATFTVLQIEDNTAYLVQYDNPSAILLRGGESVQYKKDVHFYAEKQIYESRFELQDGDMILLMSDGIVNAGMGKNASSGWKREEVETFLEGWWSPKLSPKRAASILCEAAEDLSLRSLDDDTTVLVCKMRVHRMANLLIGPPHDPKQDGQILDEFFSKQGSHIICGGTTSKLAAAYLDKPLRPLPDTATEKVPAISELEGADLVTEGFITLRETAAMGRNYLSNDIFTFDTAKASDGASLLCRELFENADSINIFFGTAENISNADLSMNLNAKLALVEEIETMLKKQGKSVNIKIC